MTAQIIPLRRKLPPPQPVAIPIIRSIVPRDPWSPRVSEPVIAGGRRGVTREIKGFGPPFAHVQIRYRVVFGPGDDEWFTLAELRADRPEPPEAA